ncbi:Protoporphyrinogen oxidase [Polystyrenella longa]|uniref:Coproporphyrinogen III oxidase n=1 Tax=Polystyrenella longa TaxID=2528007 RepID=A0A518CRS5_9PLAN|nr:protoporphyrinogen oxidase [Polystyrenella longa]QDU81932.1 Protoporphyrinogen oxidase [Polystyrenella longa]
MNISTSENNLIKVAVIGGGISGLSAANRLLEISAEQGRPIDLTLYEATARHGGLLGTEKVGEYLVEQGGDMFVTNKPWAVDLCKRLGLEDQLIETETGNRRAFVLSKGKPIEVPLGFNLMAPARIWPMIATPLLSWKAKLRMGWEYFVPPHKNIDEDESLASFVRRRLGTEALDRLIQPLVGGIYTSDPEKLSLRATLPRFIEMEREHGSLIRAMRRQAKNSTDNRAATGARYSLFVTLKGGLQQLLDALREKVDLEANYQTGHRLTKIEPLEPGYRLTFDVAHSSESVVTEVDRLLITTPAPVTARLVDSFAPSLAEPLDQIDYASCALVLSGHNVNDFDHPMDANGLVVPYVENRKVLAISFTSRKFAGRAPEGHILLRTFVGGALQPELLLQTDDEIKQFTMAEIKDIFGLKNEPDFIEISRYEGAMPQYHVGHTERIASIQKEAAVLNGFELAGNIYEGVGIPDCIHNAEEAAKRLLATN